MPEDLYALPPEQFTAARDAAAKQARADGDKAAATALRALRRPTVPAHLVNLLVRAEPDLVDQLLDLGRSLAEAQAAGSGGALRVLGEQRRALVGAVTSRAVELGDRAITAAVRGEVEATLEAAMADPGSAAAVRSGRLVRALSYAGFGDVDLEGAVAEPVAVPVPAPADDDDAAQRTRVAEAEQAAQAAAVALDDAVQACQAAQRAQDRAAAAVAEADDTVSRLEAELAGARHVQEQARQQQRESDQQVDAAGAAVRAAQEEAETARERLDRLRRVG